MTRALFTVALFTLGCAPTLVPIRFDLPVRAEVTIAEGVSTPAVETRTPFVARVESGSLWPHAGLPLTIDLDADAAGKLGGAHAMKLYGRLNVGRPMFPPGNQPIEIAPSVEDLRALVRGEVPEIVSYVVAEPHLHHQGKQRARDHRWLALVTLRTRPY
jgi:hypothetical protein